MERDQDKRTRRLLRFAFGLAAIASAGGVLAQVTPAEPFGGRPFGSDPSAPVPQQRGAAQQQQQPMVVQPGTAPVLVQPGGAPVVVQPQQPAVQVPPPQVQAPPPPPPPQPQTQQQNMAGPSGRPSSSVNAQQGNGTTSTARQERQQDGDMAVPPIVNAPPAPVTPPFTANRPPATGAAGAAGASSAQQQAVRGLPADAPKLVISGSVYSPDAARRMLIVNGQVFREGADLGSGVVLQEVRPDSAVLGFKGGRYNVYF